MRSMLLWIALMSEQALEACPGESFVAVFLMLKGTKVLKFRGLYALNSPDTVRVLCESRLIHECNRR